LIAVVVRGFIHFGGVPPLFHGKCLVAFGVFITNSLEAWKKSASHVQEWLENSHREDRLFSQLRSRNGAELDDIALSRPDLSVLSASGYSVRKVDL